MKSVMPPGIAAMFLAMLVLAVIYAMLYQGGSGVAEGARFGALIGVFSVCAFVVHNYVNLNIGQRLSIGPAVAYFVEWMVTGIVIGPHLPACREAVRDSTIRALCSAGASSLCARERVRLWRVVEGEDTVGWSCVGCHAVYSALIGAGLPSAIR
jgi:hypothetical protein